MQLQLLTTFEDQPDYLALPLDRPLAAWDENLITQVPVGVHRHVVRFVAAEERLYALKELPPRLAQREWDHLRFLGDTDIPAVDVLGVIRERGADLDDILITRHLEYSLPYRLLFRGAGASRLAGPLIDAMAVLLVRLHLVGFWWGDCSLSNTLFRRDAGSLSAWLVDTETAERHPELTVGQRELELDIAQVNVLGGLSDLEAGGHLPPEIDPTAVVESLRSRYDSLWNELTSVDHVPVTARHLIDERLARLNALGFDTLEIALDTAPDGDGLRFRPAVVEAGHNRRLLERLTGLVVQEGQAQRLLNDLQSYRAWIATQEGRNVPEAIGAYRWLTEVYEPAIAAIPPDLHDRREAPELFHEILMHRDALARRGQELRVPEAASDFAATTLPNEPSERAVIEAD